MKRRDFTEHAGRRRPQAGPFSQLLKSIEQQSPTRTIETRIDLCRAHDSEEHLKPLDSIE